MYVNNIYVVSGGNWSMVIMSDTLRAMTQSETPSGRGYQRASGGES